MNDPREPLDAEARALAARLARDPVAAPSPALDAAILAAARDAATSSSAPEIGAVDPRPTTAIPVPRPTRRPPRRRRWPMGVGVAAAFFVAIGVAWQLRPMPDERPEPASEATMAMQVRRAEPAAESSTMSAMPAADAVESAVSEPDASAPVQARRAEVPAQAVEAPSAVAETPAPPVSKQATSSPPAPMTAPSPQSPAVEADAAAVAAPRATAFGSAAMDAPRAASATSASAARAAPAAAPQALRQRERAAVAAFEDMPDEDQPPASADSPEVRDAWLERVRELLDAGDIAAARASLGEFHRRHPDADLPPDLRALLD